MALITPQPQKPAPERPWVLEGCDHELKTLSVGARRMPLVGPEANAPNRTGPGEARIDSLWYLQTYGH